MGPCRPPLPASHGRPRPGPRCLGARCASLSPAPPQRPPRLLPARRGRVGSRRVGSRRVSPAWPAASRPRTSAQGRIISRRGSVVLVLVLVGLCGCSAPRTQCCSQVSTRLFIPGAVSHPSFTPPGRRKVTKLGIFRPRPAACCWADPWLGPLRRGAGGRLGRAGTGREEPSCCPARSILLPDGSLPLPGRGFLPPARREPAPGRQGPPAARRPRRAPLACCPEAPSAPISKPGFQNASRNWPGPGVSRLVNNLCTQ